MAVIDNAEKSRFELVENGHIAYADYDLQADVISIRYVYSPAELRGQGTAGRLMEGIVEYAKSKNYKIMPICGYAVSWLRRHPNMAFIHA